MRPELVPGANVGELAPRRMRMFYCVFLPYALGHFLSCLLRTVNAAGAAADNRASAKTAQLLTVSEAVALFAQELKTSSPVSVKRLQKMWDGRSR